MTSNATMTAKRKTASAFDATPGLARLHKARSAEAIREAMLADQKRVRGEAKARAERAAGKAAAKAAKATKAPRTAKGGPLAPPRRQRPTAPTKAARGRAGAAATGVIGLANAANRPFVALPNQPGTGRERQ
jgi:hypothetical protein